MFSWFRPRNPQVLYFTFSEARAYSSNFRPRFACASLCSPRLLTTAMKDNTDKEAKRNVFLAFRKDTVFVRWVYFHMFQPKHIRRNSISLGWVHRKNIITNQALKIQGPDISNQCGFFFRGWLFESEEQQSFSFVGIIFPILIFLRHYLQLMDGPWPTFAFDHSSCMVRHFSVASAQMPDAKEVVDDRRWRTLKWHNSNTSQTVSDGRCDR